MSGVSGTTSASVPASIHACIPIVPVLYPPMASGAALICLFPSPPTSTSNQSLRHLLTPLPQLLLYVQRRKKNRFAATPRASPVSREGMTIAFSLAPSCLPVRPTRPQESPTATYRIGRPILILPPDTTYARALATHPLWIALAASVQGLMARCVICHYRFFF